jgi:hypothetical protein
MATAELQKKTQLAEEYSEENGTNLALLRGTLSTSTKKQNNNNNKIPPNWHKKMENGTNG